MSNYVDKFLDMSNEEWRETISLYNFEEECRMVDSMILQTLEEYYESIISEDKENYQDELTDTVLYLCSFASYLRYDYFDNFNEEEVKKKLSSYNVGEVNYNDLINILFSNLLSIRRMYPERKYHVAYNTEDLATDEDRMEAMYRIYVCFSYILTYMNDNGLSLSERKIEKSKNILQKKK